MKKLNLLLIPLLAAVIGLGGCSKKEKGAEKIIGKWKAENLEKMPDTTMTVEIFYEFTKDKLIAEGTMQGQPLPTMEISYTVKSDADTLILEATHPQTGSKGDFKITFSGETVMMTDPDGAQYQLVKRE